MTFVNNSDNDVSEITVTVHCFGTVTAIGGNVCGVVDGDTAQVTFRNYGNPIKAHNTYSDIHVFVSGVGTDFGIETLQLAR
jgi:hypothetical protein